jgi:hypothetical protein
MGTRGQGIGDRGQFLNTYSSATRDLKPEAYDL